MTPLRSIGCAAAALFSRDGGAGDAQSSPDLGAMLRDAQRYTVKVRATVNWPLAPSSSAPVRAPAS